MRPAPLPESSGYLKHNGLIDFFLFPFRSVGLPSSGSGQPQSVSGAGRVIQAWSCLHLSFSATIALAVLLRLNPCGFEPGL